MGAATEQVQIEKRGTSVLKAWEEGDDPAKKGTGVGRRSGE